MKKVAIRFLSGLYVLVLILPLFLIRANAETIKDVSKLKGSNYTDNEALAAKLDQVFSGDIKLYSDSRCTKKINAPVGSKQASSITAYVGSKDRALNSGNTCWIYANAVYYTLFDAITYDYKPVYNNSAYTKGNSAPIEKKSYMVELIDGKTKGKINDDSFLISYEHFQQWGVVTGARVQTCKYSFTRSDKTRASSSGHSFIVLSYDKDYLITLEGNYPKHGEITVQKRPWADYTGKGPNSRAQRYVNYIMQPTEECVEAKYPSAKNVYTIIFISNAPNGVTVTGTMEDLEMTGSEKKELPANIFKAIGHTFEGWNTNADGTGDNYPDQGTVKYLTKEDGVKINLYAQWKKFDYLDLCTDRQDTYVTVSVNKSGQYVKSLPCSEKTDARSENLNSSSLPIGTSYLATEIICNSEGNYWYKVQYAGNKTGYLPGSVVDASLPSGIISWKHSFPAQFKQGEDPNLSGTIKTAHGTIATVGAMFTGNQSIYQRVEIKNNPTEIDLSKQTELNNALDLTQVPVGKGEYWLGIGVRIPVISSDGKSVLKDEVLGSSSARKSFTVIPQTYTYTFNANGGSGGPGTRTKTQGTALVIPAAVPARTGYSFKGWALKDNATGAQYQVGAELTDEKNLTLYAVWEKNLEYMSHCKKEADTYLTVKAIGSNDHIMSLPCSSDTNSSSKSQIRLSDGQQMTATAIWANNWGNYWYQVTANINGKSYSGYFPGNKAAFVKFPVGTVTGTATVANPVTQGKDQSIGGKLSSNIATMRTVSATLQDSAKKSWTASSAVNGTSFSFSGSSIDNTLNFGGMASGQGTLSLKVTLNAPSIVSLKQTGTAEETVTLTRKVFQVNSTASSSTVTGYNYTYYPTYVKLKAVKQDGKNGVIKSLPRSDEKEVESKNVRTMTAGETLTATSVVYNGYHYWYQVTADKDGATGYIYGGYAQVTEIPGDALAAENLDLPELLPQGKAKSFGGTIKGRVNGVKVTEARGILTGSNGGTQTQSAKASNGTLKVNESNINKKLKFGSLPAGQAKLTVYATVEVPVISSDTKTGKTQELLWAEEYTWMVAPYGIYYNANGGSGAPSAQIKTYGTDLTISATKPTREGYVFQGWSANASATSATYQPGGKLKTDTYYGNDLTLYAVWKSAEQVTLTYNANGGSGAPAAQKVNKGGKAAVASGQPTRTGYTFLGWATSSGAATPAYYAGNSVTMNGNLTLYAVWQKNVEMVTLEYVDMLYGSTPPQGVTVPKGTVITIADSQELEKFYFENWLVTDGSYIGEIYAYPGDQFTVNEYRQLVAVYARKAELNYDANGGSGGPAVQYEVVNGGITIPSTRPTRDGYRFIGWAKGSSSTEAQYQPGDLFEFHSDTTLYAVWEKNVTLSYHVNGGIEADTPQSQTTQKGGTLTITTRQLVRDGYAFLGWSENQNAEEASYQPGDSITLNNDVTLYAVWLQDAERFYFAFGEGASTPPSVIHWEEIGGGPEHRGDVTPEEYDITEMDHIHFKVVIDGLPDGFVPAMDCQHWQLTFTFPLWKTADQVYEGDLYTTRGGYYRFNLLYEGENILTSSTHFEKEFTDEEPMEISLYGIELNPGEGTLESLAAGEKGYIIKNKIDWSGYEAYSNIAKKPKLEEHVFEGWATSAEAAEPDYLSDESYQFNQALKLYAVWKESADCTLTFDANGGTEAPEAQTVKEGEEVCFIVQNHNFIPKRSGYAFLGWAESSTATAPDYDLSAYSHTITMTEDKTLYAVWDQDDETTYYLVMQTGDSSIMRFKNGTAMTVYDADFTTLADAIIEFSFTPAARSLLADPYDKWVNAGLNIGTGEHQTGITGYLGVEDTGSYLYSEFLASPGISGFVGYFGNRDGGPGAIFPNQTGLVLEQEIVVDSATQPVYRMVSFFQLTCDPNGGTVQDETGRRAVDSDGCLRLLATGMGSDTVSAVRGDDTFLGWSTDPNATEAEFAGGNISLDGMSEDTILYAVWGQKSSLSTAAAGKKLVKAPPVAEVEKQESGEETAQAGNADTEKEKIPESDSAPANTPEEELTTVTVTFDACGGSGGPSIQTATEGESLTVSEETPTREGFAFQGWATEAEPDKVSYKAGDEIVLTENTTLYAVWQKIEEEKPVTQEENNQKKDDTKTTEADQNVEKIEEVIQEANEAVEVKAPEPETSIEPKQDESQEPPPVVPEVPKSPEPSNDPEPPKEPETPAAQEKQVQSTDEPE